MERGAVGIEDTGAEEEREALVATGGTEDWGVRRRVRRRRLPRLRRRLRRLRRLRRSGGSGGSGGWRHSTLDLTRTTAQGVGGFFFEQKKNNDSSLRPTILQKKFFVGRPRIFG